MDFNILYWIQSLRSPFLDGLMVKVFNDLVGSKGELWILLGILLLLLPKTRKTGDPPISSRITSVTVS